MGQFKVEYANGWGESNFSTEPGVCSNLGIPSPVVRITVDPPNVEYNLYSSDLCKSGFLGAYRGSEDFSPDGIPARSLQETTEGR